MTFDQIFTAYYSLFRADSDVPASTDDEYTVGLRLANEAINYWANYDSTRWNVLYDTNQTDGSGAQTIVTNQKTYSTPTNFAEAGGFARVLDSNSNEQVRYPIVEPHEVQYLDSMGEYCYFTGDPANGYTLHINPAPTANLSGMDLEYVYYKTPTQYSTGTSKSEIPNGYFVVHRMLYNQLRASRNPYMDTALRDAEDAIKKMQLDNVSGSWANPPSLADNSAMQFGS